MRKRFKKWAYYSKNNSYSMSQGAEEAYDKGLKPLSKWKKADILDELISVKGLAVDLELEKNKTKDQLIADWLTPFEWHHVGKYARQVWFYGIK